MEGQLPEIGGCGNMGTKNVTLKVCPKQEGVRRNDFLC